MSNPVEAKELSVLLDEKLSELLYRHAAQPGKTIESSATFQVGESGPIVQLILRLEGAKD